MFIEKRNPAENVNRFLEVSLAPTVMLFKSLTNITKLKRNERIDNLIKIFKNVKSYSVTSDFDYKKNFNFLLDEISLLRD